MVQSPDKSVFLVSTLSSNGLTVFGSFQIEASDCPEGKEGFANKHAFLIGNIGSSIWPYFSSSSEAIDGLAHPLDRWTARVMQGLAVEIKASVIYPFESPYWPFQRFAKRVGNFNSSPLGILIHSDYGLWQAYRAVVVVEGIEEYSSLIRDLSQTTEEKIHPCDACSDKPCLSACPVDAFEGVTLDRARCMSHLYSGNSPNCTAMGCQARAACPVGSEHIYDAPHLQFHMNAYKK